MKEWLMSIAAKKLISHLVLLAAAKLSAVGLDKVGISLSLDTDLLTGAIFGGYETLRNYVKVKKGWSWL